jgi:hypothetical protein
MQAALFVLFKNGLYTVHSNDKEALHRTAVEQSQLSLLAALTGKFEMCHTDPSIANPAHTRYRQYMRFIVSRYAGQTELTW